MKRIFFLMIGWIVMTNVHAKEFEFNKAYYGANLYQSSTGSGYGPSYYMSLNVQKNQRLFELGILVSSINQRFMGFEFMYKHFTGYKKASFYSKTIKPYFHYNFLYRRPEPIILGNSALLSTSFNPNYSGGLMTTYEHSIGFGMQVQVLKQIALDANLGFGVYFGSKYQGMHPNTWGIHKDNFGFVPSFKLGVGYQF